MPDNGKPATGPLIMEQLLHLTEEVRSMREAQERRDKQLRALSDQVDRFLAAEIDITGTLVQVRSVVSANRDTVSALRAAAEQLERTITTAFELASSDPSAHARDRAA